MAKHQREELAPARHAFGVLLRLMLVHRRIENCSREKFENLLENAGYLFHGWVSPSVELLVTDQLYQERPPGSPTLSDRYTRLGWLMNVLDSSAKNPSHTNKKYNCALISTIYILITLKSTVHGYKLMVGDQNEVTIEIRHIPGQRR